MIQDPDAIESYIYHVFERGKMLIENRLWNGIDVFRYKGWWKNFTSPQERLFAALLIDRLMFRSEEHMLSMLFDLFTMAIPNCMRINNDPDYVRNRRLLDLLTQRRESQIRLVNINEDNRPSQSSGEILNLINHKMDIKRNNIIYQKDIKSCYDSGLKSFILVDDMICTGEQIKGALDRISPNSYPDARFYVAVCSACDKGVGHINSHYPSIGIAYTEYLEINKHSFFESFDYSSIPFESAEDMKIFYEGFTISKGFLRNKLYGKDNLALVYAFQNSTPNVSLPILYWKNELFNQFLNKRGA